jgi:hypothetical protein
LTDGGEEEPRRRTKVHEAGAFYALKDLHVLTAEGAEEAEEVAKM